MVEARLFRKVTFRWSREGVHSVMYVNDIHFNNKEKLNKDSGS